MSDFIKGMLIGIVTFLALMSGYLFFELQSLKKEVEFNEDTMWMTFFYHTEEMHVHMCVEHHSQNDCNYLNETHKLLKMKPKHQWSPGHAPEKK